MLNRMWHAMKRAYTRTIDTYAEHLAKRPYTTQCTTSAVLWSLGDFGAQAVERAADETDTPTDWRRVGLITAYGGAFVGPLGHAWYERLDTLARAICKAGTMRFVALKIMADTVVFGPIHVASFFGIVGLAERESLEEVGDRLRTDFWPTLLAESVAWPVVQGFNFWLVPVQHQLLVVNIVSLADCTFLSFVKHQGDSGAWQRFIAEANKGNRFAAFAGSGDRGLDDMFAQQQEAAAMPAPSIGGASSRSAAAAQCAPAPAPQAHEGSRQQQQAAAEAAVQVAAGAAARAKQGPDEQQAG